MLSPKAYNSINSKILSSSVGLRSSARSSNVILSSHANRGQTASPYANRCPLNETITNSVSSWPSLKKPCSEQRGLDTSLRCMIASKSLQNYVSINIVMIHHFSNTYYVMCKFFQLSPVQNCRIY